MGFRGPAIWCAIALVSLPAHAENVVLRLKAINPSVLERTVPVRRSLPRGVTREDVVDAGAMEIDYDAREGVYYVHANPTLSGGESITYSIVLRDVWTISAERVAELRSHAAALRSAISGEDPDPDAEAAYKEIESVLQRVGDHQEAFAADQAGVVAHIEAYEECTRLLDHARKKIGGLEELAVKNGLDPRALYGKPEAAPRSERISIVPGGEPLRKVVTVSNPSQEVVTNAVKVYLPPEVRIPDVDTGGTLDVLYDSVEGACYVFSDSVVVDPGDTVSFEVLVTNRWMIDDAELKSMEELAGILQEKALKADRQVFVDEAASLLKRIDRVRSIESPTELSAEVIAVYRRKVELIDDIHASLLRLEELMKPQRPPPPFSPKLNDPVSSPDKRTTWIIVYIMLGFMLVITLLFFLRWYGKSKPEEMAI